MADLTYKLDVFEGPLDLLLHLISKNKLNIDDIPLFELIEQYLEFIKKAEEQDMDIASEFLEMASRLVYLKTVSLLPKHEEADRLKEELTGELLEYSICRQMAQKLSTMTEGFDCFIRKPMEIDPDKKYLLQHDPEALYEAYFSAVGRGKRKLPPSTEPFEKIVAKKVVSVPSKIIHVLRTLVKKGKSKFRELFSVSKSRSEIVATFLAVLELVKSNRLHIEGQGEDSSVTLIKERKKK